MKATINYNAYVAVSQVNQRFMQAVQLGLENVGVTIEQRYAASVPSKRVRAAAGHRVTGPHVIIGDRDFRSRFLEVGAKPHQIIATGRKPVKVRTKSGRWRKTKRFHQGPKVLAFGGASGNMVFAPRVHHPGMRAGHYLRRAMEGAAAYAQDELTRRLAEAFK